MSDFFLKGYEYLFSENGFESTIFKERFAPAKGFHNPVVLGFEYGEIMILWLDSDDSKQELVQALEIILSIKKDSQTGSTGHQYIIQQASNIFSSVLYQALQPQTPVGVEETERFGMVTGNLALATGTN